MKKQKKVAGKKLFPFYRSGNSFRDIKYLAKVKWLDKWQSQNFDLDQTFLP